MTNTAEHSLTMTQQMTLEVLKRDVTKLDRRELERLVIDAIAMKMGYQNFVYREFKGEDRA